jgi:DNA repair photolyase
MHYKEIKARTLINKITIKDSLFLGDYTIDPYQNCEFGCRYCDSTFEDIIYIKQNITNLLESELQHIPKGIIIIGSVNDPYQKIEKKFKITQTILKYIKKFNFQCHILTKSDLILRDINILQSMDNPIVTISISSLDDQIVNKFEKNVITPFKRLCTIKKLNDKNIYTGLAVIPYLPFIIENEIEIIFQNASKYNSKYLLYKYLELKGYQKNIFFDILKEYLPNLIFKYEELYRDSYIPKEKYIKKINKLFDKYYKWYRILSKI